MKNCKKFCATGDYVKKNLPHASFCLFFKAETETDLPTNIQTSQRTKKLGPRRVLGSFIVCIIVKCMIVEFVCVLR